MYYGGLHIILLIDESCGEFGWNDCNYWGCFFPN